MSLFRASRTPCWNTERADGAGGGGAAALPLFDTRIGASTYLEGPGRQISLCVSAGGADLSASAGGGDVKRGQEAVLCALQLLLFSTPALGDLADRYFSKFKNIYKTRMGCLQSRRLQS